MSLDFDEGRQCTRLWEPDVVKGEATRDHPALRVTAEDEQEPDPEKRRCMVEKKYHSFLQTLEAENKERLKQARKEFGCDGGNDVSWYP